jgi:hypothetical protein
MQIPTFSSTEEKKEWWLKNAGEMAQQSIINKQTARTEQKKLSAIPIPPNVRIVYLRIKGRPVGCFVTELDLGNYVMKYQYSAYNPKDKYNKFEGKRIALRRLAEDPYIVFGNNKDITPYQLKHAATESLTGKLPSKFPGIDGSPVQTPIRIIRAAQEWLEFRANTDYLSEQQVRDTVHEITSKLSS